MKEYKKFLWFDLQEMLWSERGYEAWSWIMLWYLQVEWIAERAWFDARAIGLISN